MKPPPYLFYGPNGLCGACGTSLTFDHRNRFPKNRFSVQIFLQNHPLAYFRGKTNYVVRLWAKLFRTKNFARFSLESLRNRFSEKKKKRLQAESFLRNRPLSYFLCQTDYVARLGVKLFQTKNSLTWKAPEIVFSKKKKKKKKKIFDSNFHTKPPSYLFSGQNRLCGSFGGKIVHDENFAHFCLESPRNHFAKEKHFRFKFLYETASLPIFAAKQTLWCVWGQHCFGQKLRSIFARTTPYFWGQTDYVALFGEKLFRTKTSLDFPLRALETIFPKKHVFDPNFFTKSPS
jgi:hypothetical protein